MTAAKIKQAGVEILATSRTRPEEAGTRSEQSFLARLASQWVCVGTIRLFGGSAAQSALGG